MGVYLENSTKSFGEFSIPQVTTDDDRNRLAQAAILQIRKAPQTKVRLCPSGASTI